jgi:hypothetical protein
LTSLHAVVGFSFFASVLNVAFAVVCVVNGVRNVAEVAIMLLLAFEAVEGIRAFAGVPAFVPGIPYANIQGIPLEFLAITQHKIQRISRELQEFSTG